MTRPLPIWLGPLILALCFPALVSGFMGCSHEPGERADAAATHARDAADAAAIAAAEHRARLASGRATAAEVEAEEARATALARLADAAEARAAAIAAEGRRVQAEARAEKLRQDAQAARDSLGWWFAATGGALLAGAAGLAAFGLWIGLAPRLLGFAGAAAAAGLIAVLLGISWDWLPWVASGLLVVAVIAVVVGLIRSGRAAAAYAGDAEHVDPNRPQELDRIQERHAAQQVAAGVHRAVGWLRGRSAKATAAGLKNLRDRLATTSDTPPRRDDAEVMR